MLTFSKQYKNDEVAESKSGDSEDNNNDAEKDGSSMSEDTKRQPLASIPTRLLNNYTLSKTFCRSLF